MCEDQSDTFFPSDNCLFIQKYRYTSLQNIYENYGI